MVFLLPPSFCPCPFFIPFPAATREQQKLPVATKQIYYYSHVQNTSHLIQGTVVYKVPLPLLSPSTDLPFLPCCFSHCQCFHRSRHEDVGTLRAASSLYGITLPRSYASLTPFLLSPYRPFSAFPGPPSRLYFPSLILNSLLFCLFVLASFNI